MAAVGVVFLIAAWNRFRLVPTVTSTEPCQRAWAKLRTTVASEALILFMVAMLTGFLVGQSPLETASAPVEVVAPDRVTFDEPFGAGHVLGSIESTAGVDSVLTFSLMDGSMDTLEPIEPPRVLISLPAANLGPIENEAVEAGTPGSFRADLRFPASGTWEITISARVSRFEEHSAVFEVEVP